MMKEKNALKQLFNTSEKIFYKVTKSTNRPIEGYFEEAFMKYKENARMQKEGDYPLCFCCDKSKLLACAVYGDQLTQIIVDKRNKFRQKLYRDNYKFGDEIEMRRWGEVNADVLHTGFHFSLGDIAVLRECMLFADKDSFDMFFNFKNENQKHIEDIYEKNGYKDIGKFIRNIRVIYENATKLSYQRHGFNFEQYMRRSIERTFPKNKEDFSFRASREFYIDTYNLSPPPFQKVIKKVYSKEEEREQFIPIDVAVTVAMDCGLPFARGKIYSAFSGLADENGNIRITTLSNITGMSKDQIRNRIEFAEKYAQGDEVLNGEYVPTVSTEQGQVIVEKESDELSR